MSPDSHVNMMSPSAIGMYEDYYPVPFPKDAPTIPLAKISVAKLLNGDEAEAEKLFSVCCAEGFFYLDLTTEPRGKEFMREANQLHHVAKDVFENVSFEERSAFKASDTTGHLDTG